MIAGAFTTRPEIDGRFGVVASTHWIGTAVGMGVLERGGNAFDAGVATAFALQVVEPHLNGPGGDVPLILHHAASDRTEVVCGQGPAPAGATIAAFRDLGLDLIPGTGPLAACVPGTFDTYMRVLRDYGTMRLRDVIEAAISYARHGYPLLPRVCETIATVAPLFRDHWPSSAAIYLPGGDVPVPGTLFSNPELADTYTRLLSEAAAGGGGREAEIERARHAWRQGFVAEAIDRFFRAQEVPDGAGHRYRGVLTGHDMAVWESRVEAPLRYNYGRFTVMKPGTWTQGLVALQQLALLRSFDLDRLAPNGAELIHLTVESAKLAFADRDTFYGDPDFVDVPVDKLLSDAYNDARRPLISDRASMEQRPGTILGFGKAVDIGLMDASRRAPTTAGVGEPTAGRLGQVRGDTVHFDIIDHHGNMVTATPSGGWLQSSPVIPGLGFCLGTRAQMFWLDADHPASLQPGKRPRSTLSPTMALRDGRPYLAWGSPGGDQQDQWSVQLLLRHAHAGLNLQESIDASAWHTEHAPSSFWPRLARPGVVVLEGQVPEAEAAELRRRGHIVERGPDWSEGRLTAASREDAPGGGLRLRAAANPRGMQGYAAGR